MISLKREYLTKIMMSTFLKGWDLRRYIRHIAISVFLGLVSGAGAIAFHFLLSGGKSFSVRVQHIAGHYAVIMVPVVGSIIIIVLVRIFPAQAAEKGVVNVIKALIREKGYISIKTTLFNFIAPLVSIGSGAPLGPEAPAAQIGCGIGSFISRKLRFSSNDVVMYTAAAGGAAIAAVFNAPIAGVFFGVEVLLLNDMKNNALSALIIATVTSNLLSRNLMGDIKVFSFPQLKAANLSDYSYLLALGLICGFMSLLYSILAVKTRTFFFRKKYPYLMLPVVALIFGFVLLWMPHLYGVGYESITLTASGHFDMYTLAALFFIKFIFVIAFLAAGGYGGTFAPSLVLGAVGGYLFSNILNAYFGLSCNSLLCCLAGMGGMLAGMNSAPLTAIMLVFEMTNDYRLVLPLMITSIISYVFTINYNKHTIYTIALLGSGIDVTRRGESDVLGSVQVRNLTMKPYSVISMTMTFNALILAVLAAEEGTVFVNDSGGKLCGIISLANIRQTIAVAGMEYLFIASDLMTPFAAVTQSSSISDAAEAAEQCGTPLIPVVDSFDSRQVIGAISEHDIISAYNEQMEKRTADEFFMKYSYRY